MKHRHQPSCIDLFKTVGAGRVILLQPETLVAMDRRAHILLLRRR